MQFPEPGNLPLPHFQWSQYFTFVKNSLYCSLLCDVFSGVSGWRSLMSSSHSQQMGSVSSTPFCVSYLALSYLLKFYVIYLIPPTRWHFGSLCLSISNTSLHSHTYKKILSPSFLCSFFWCHLEAPFGRYLSAPGCPTVAYFWAQIGPKHPPFCNYHVILKWRVSGVSGYFAWCLSRTFLLQIPMPFDFLRIEGKSYYDSVIKIIWN